MSKAPSEATQIRTLKARLAEAEKDRSALARERDAYRVRATKAEQECAEWRERFDILLRRDGKKAGAPA
jgi:outer membrane murein-binding lipoprotein Lpp